MLLLKHWTIKFVFLFRILGELFIMGAQSTTYWSREAWTLFVDLLQLVMDSGTKGHILCILMQFKTWFELLIAEVEDAVKDKHVLISYDSTNLISTVWSRERGVDELYNWTQYGDEEGVSRVQSAKCMVLSTSLGQWYVITGARKKLFGGHLPSTFRQWLWKVSNVWNTHTVMTIKMIMEEATMCGQYWCRPDPSYISTISNRATQMVWWSISRKTNVEFIPTMFSGNLLDLTHVDLIYLKTFPSIGYRTSLLTTVIPIPWQRHTSRWSCRILFWEH